MIPNTPPRISYVAGTSATERRPEADRKRTPLPAGQLSILLFLRFCESASTSVIYPFLDEFLALVTGEEEKVGYYAGIMEFTRQALSLATVMLWSRLSDHIGRKPILLLGTFALAMSMISFGLSSVFWALVASRCIFTGLNSNAGVIKGMIGEITDETNTAQAFAFLHVPWASGYAIGALLGGWFARPHDHFPSLFRGQLWVEHPFFLPCLMVACLSLVACLVASLCLRETLPGTFFSRNNRFNHSISGDDDISQPLLSRPSGDDKPPPLSSFLTLPILLACTNYCILGGLHSASSTLQPLFLAMPISVGGLALPSHYIGYILGTYGLVNALVQTFLLSRLIRKFGVKKVFVSAMVSLIPIFILPPAMNFCLRKHGWDNLWWGWCVRMMLVIQVVCGFVLELGYGSIYIFINASAPNRRSLGAVNGLGQTLVSIGRIFLPALASSLLSFSIEHRILGGYGYLAYGALLIITMGGIAVALRLPKLG